MMVIIEDTVTTDTIITTEAMEKETTEAITTITITAITTITITTIKGKKDTTTIITGTIKMVKHTRLTQMIKIIFYKKKLLS